MSVGVAPPLLDWSLVAHREEVSQAMMEAVQDRLAESHGYFIGNTSAACLAVALDAVRPAAPQHKVLVLVYDHGLWYAGGRAAAA
jgi:cysteine synthase